MIFVSLFCLAKYLFLSYSFGNYGIPSLYFIVSERQVGINIFSGHEERWFGVKYPPVWYFIIIIINSTHRIFPAVILAMEAGKAGARGIHEYLSNK